jgi:hypothetical protein
VLWLTVFASVQLAGVPIVGEPLYVSAATSKLPPEVAIVHEGDAVVTLPTAEPAAEALWRSATAAFAGRARNATNPTTTSERRRIAVLWRIEALGSLPKLVRSPAVLELTQVSSAEHSLYSHAS